MCALLGNLKGTAYSVVIVVAVDFELCLFTFVVFVSAVNVCAHVVGDSCASFVQWVLFSISCENSWFILHEGLDNADFTSCHTFGTTLFNHFHNCDVLTHVDSAFMTICSVEVGIDILFSLWLAACVRNLQTRAFSTAFCTGASSVGKQAVLVLVVVVVVYVTCS